MTVVTGDLATGEASLGVAHAPADAPAGGDIGHVRPLSALPSPAPLPCPTEELTSPHVLPPATVVAAAPVGEPPPRVRAWFDTLVAAELPEHDGSLASARQSADAYARRAKAANTRRAYMAGVRAWCTWCDQHALPCLPASGADVAASTDITGAAWMGGDWTLEAASGSIETATLAVEDYEGVLASGILRNAYIRFGYSDDGTLGYGSNSKPGVQYASSKIPTASTSPDSRAGGGEAP